MIAATQKGKMLEFAGTITPLGKLIGKGIYECTTEAIEKTAREGLIYHDSAFNINHDRYCDRSNYW